MRLLYRVDMSNRVVWELLNSLILNSLDRLGYVEETYSVERMGEEHPLVIYLEERLNRFFTPSGGLSCPELEERIRDMLSRDPEGMRKLVDSYVRSYYSGRRRREPGYRISGRVVDVLSF